MKIYVKVIIWILWFIVLWLISFIIYENNHSVNLTTIDDSRCPEWSHVVGKPKFENSTLKHAWDSTKNQKKEAWIGVCNDCELTKKQIEKWIEVKYNDKCKNTEKICLVCIKEPTPGCQCTAEFINVKLN